MAVDIRILMVVVRIGQFSALFVAGHLVFQSLLISVGLGATAMGVAATSADGVRANQRSAP